MQQVTTTIAAVKPLTLRTAELFDEQQRNVYNRTDHMFAWLMVFQWIGGILAALWISPRAWEGAVSQTHLHVWAAVFLGGMITAFPVLLALTQPGRASTRHTIAIGQALTSGLLIHLSGGRIETHFHVFGSLAFLALYRDWRVLISASAVVLADHLLRGAFWPQSVYGVLSAPIWRAFEHGGWVIFEDTILIFSIRQSCREMLNIAERQATLEATNQVLEVEIAERKKVEEQLLQSQKLKAVGRLAGGVAHDFNNLLTVITGFTEAIQRKIDPSSPLQRDTEQIRKAADRAVALTHQLLAFSRNETIQPKILNLNEVVADMDTMLRRLIGANIELITILGASLGRIRVDQGQIGQVIVNLAVNAHDAMPHGGKLTITTSNVTLDESFCRQHSEVKPGPYVQLVVSDTGLGMRPEVVSRAFEPFFTTKEQGKGTGLGLATCYGIVKQDGGHIQISSELDHGTTVTICLPSIAVSAPGDDHNAPADAMPAGSETVLLVEDEPALRELVAVSLRDLGYTVLEAANGEEGLRLAQQRNGQGLDLLLTDVVMPLMGGKELADHMAALYPDVKLLFTSGYTNQAIGRNGVLDASIAYLQKPFTSAMMAKKVRAVLDRVA